MNAKPSYYRKDENFHMEKGVKSLLSTICLLILGSTLLAIGYALFIVPHQIVPGGVTGLSIMGNYLTGLPIGTLAILINLPLFFFGFKILGKKFALKSFIAMLLSSALIDAILYFTKQKALSDDILVSCLLGGALIGSGIGLVLQAGATTGGTDIIARLLARFSKSPVGKMFLLVDGLIVISSIFVFGKIDVAPYAVVAIFVISKSVDAIILGAEQKKAVIVISDHLPQIRQVILSEMDRGGTYLQARGLYFDEQDKQLIFTVLSRREMIYLQGRVKELDPNAFLTVLDTRDVIGSGFKSFS